MIQRDAEAVVEIDTAQPMRRGAGPIPIGLATEIETAGDLIAETSDPPTVDVDGSFTEHDLRTLACYIGDAVSLRTKAFPWATSYEWEVTHEENRTTERFITTLPTALWTPRKVGHFTPRVRAVNATSSGQWISTQDARFWLFAWIAPPKF